MKANRIGFAGSPQFAADVLQIMLAADLRPEVLYCQPDRRAGRGRKLQFGPAKQVAEAAGIPIEQPHNFKQQAEQDRLAAYELDVLVVVAYGLVLPQSVLDLPKHGCVNVHASALPNWRGAAPIARAIEAGDPRLGVDLMQMQLALDAGPVLASAEIETGTHTTASASDALAALGGELLIAQLPKVLAGTARPTPQNEAMASYAPKLAKAEGQLDWSSDALTLLRKIKAFNPYPVAFSALDDEVLRFWDAELGADEVAGEIGQILALDASGMRVQCADRSLCITQIQRPGKRRCAAGELAHSLAWQGKVLGSVQ